MARAMSYQDLRRKAKNNKRKMQAGRGAKYADKYKKYRAQKRASAARPAYKKNAKATSAVSSAPVQMGTSVSGGLQSSFTQKQMGDGSLRITGRSFITQIDTNNKYTNGLVAVHDCNPVLLNDRVATISTTYEKYVYQSVTYRYVPQCSTTTAGSVMLTFERDPANPAANGGDGNFMQNVMSYEHTAITPPWVGSSVTYKRDKSEKKTFFISGQGSNYDPRGTSQGLFMCYGTNLPINTGLGFIVMDYVLDLCQPSIMPARTGAGIAGSSSTNIPSQWQFSASTAATKLSVVNATSNINQFFDLSNGLFGTVNQNCVLELFLESTTVPSTGNVRLSTNEVNAKAATPIATTLGRGSHLYLTIRRRTAALAAGVPDAVNSSDPVVIITRNLADAIAALSGSSDLVTTTGLYAYNNALYPLENLAINTDLQIAGFYRQLTMKGSDDGQV